MAISTSTMPAADANRTSESTGRHRGPAVAVTAAVAIAAVAGAFASGPAGPAVSGQALPEGGDVTGVVRSAGGPEEGVWVIAETDDLATRFIKSVVTGDGGRFLIPDLPPARYEVWVRGYGLVDSAHVEASPGDELALEAVVAATEAEAAKVYPANYWYSLIEPPAASEFPGTGADGNGIAATLTDQSQWIDIQKQGCMLCHQLGSRIVREIDNRDEFDSTLAAWDHRVQMGQRGSQMTNVMNASVARAAWRCSPTGATASRPAPSRRARRGPRASSATSS